MRNRHLQYLRLSDCLHYVKIQIGIASLDDRPNDVRFSAHYVLDHDRDATRCLAPPQDWPQVIASVGHCDLHVGRLLGPVRADILRVLAGIQRDVGHRDWHNFLFANSVRLVLLPYD